MSFAKAEQLLDLAVMCAGRRAGITLDDVVERFGGSKRTAQRMLARLALQFPDAEDWFDEEGRKRWRLPAAGLRDLMTVTPEETAALDHAAELLAKSGASDQGRALRALKDKVMALVPRDKARRLETDHDALLEAQGFVARPGPRPKSDEAVSAVLAEAIKACLVLEIDYRPRTGKQTTRRVMPYGLLSGVRRYLVVKDAAHPDDVPSLRAIDRIAEARLTEQSFVRDGNFDLVAYAKRSFGAFQSEGEFGEVVWRFAPEAAAQARDFLFHPDQAVCEDADGSLVVRFAAAGHLEMAWHLYMWGDKVEVLEPAALRKLVAKHRRGDWPALP